MTPVPRQEKVARLAAFKAAHAKELLKQVVGTTGPSDKFLSFIDTFEGMDLIWEHWIDGVLQYADLRGSNQAKEDLEMNTNALNALKGQKEPWYQRYRMTSSGEEPINNNVYLETFHAAPDSTPEEAVA